MPILIILHIFFMFKNGNPDILLDDTSIKVIDLSCGLTDSNQTELQLEHLKSNRVTSRYIDSVSLITRPTHQLNRDLQVI